MRKTSWGTARDPGWGSLQLSGPGPGWQGVAVGTRVGAGRPPHASRIQVTPDEKACGITEYVWPFHDARHGALTNMAATGRVSPIALMATAGHSSMATTNRYLHLAGVVFRDEAEALARRYNFVPDSGDLSQPEDTEGRIRTANPRE